MKNYFLTGIIILMPIALTIMILLFLIDFLTAPFISIVTDLLKFLENTLHFQIPTGLILPTARVFALVLLVVFILVLGVMAHAFLIRKVFAFWDWVMSRIPFIRTVYKVSRDIFSALFSSDGKKAFKETVLVPFPFSPASSIGFHAGEVASEIQEKIDQPLISVFMPTAPHPISGFLLFVPKSKAPTVPMNNEDSVKFLVSCGIIQAEMEDQ